MLSQIASNITEDLSIKSRKQIQITKEKNKKILEEIEGWMEWYYYKNDLDFFKLKQKLIKSNPKTKKELHDSIKNIIFKKAQKIEKNIDKYSQWHSFYYLPQSCKPKTKAKGMPKWMENIYKKPLFISKMLGKIAYFQINGEIEYDTTLINTGLKLIHELVDKNPIGWILDFRYFLGGSDSVSSSIFKYFFDKNLLGKYQLLAETQNVTFDDKILKEGNYRNYKVKKPIAILIGRNTSSAGEFTVKYLSVSNKNVRTFGSRTNGRMSVNNAIDLDSGASIQYVMGIYIHKNKVYHYLIPDNKTSDPLKDAKIWVKKNQ